MKSYGLGEGAHDVPFFNFCLQVWRTLVCGFHFFARKGAISVTFSRVREKYIEFSCYKAEFLCLSRIDKRKKL